MCLLRSGCGTRPWTYPGRVSLGLDVALDLGHILDVSP